MGSILIVEDDDIYRDSLAILLARAGHSVRVARSPTEGIREAMADTPDLLIVDWMLKSDLYGGEVAKQIRAAYPQVTTIVITGHPEVAQRVRRSYTFIREVIQKPFRAEEIVVAAERALKV